MSYDTFKCFVFNALCSKAKQLRIVLRHGIRPDCLQIYLLVFSGVSSVNVHNFGLCELVWCDFDCQLHCLAKLLQLIDILLYALHMYNQGKMKWRN